MTEATVNVEPEACAMPMKIGIGVHVLLYESAHELSCCVGNPAIPICATVVVLLTVVAAPDVRFVPKAVDAALIDHERLIANSFSVSIAKLLVQMRLPLYPRRRSEERRVGK